MHVAELPLVLFTILAQLSVGSFVVLGVIQLVARLRGVDPRTVDRLTDPALYVIGPVIVLGLAASTLHMGNPINALNTVRNLETSWLSREILFTSAFVGLGAVFAVCQWFKWLTPVLRQVLAGLTAVVGLGQAYVTSMVYMLPTVPAWDTWATPVSFFTTAFLLGTLNIGAAFVGVTAFRARRARRAAAAPVAAGDDADAAVTATTVDAQDEHVLGLLRTTLRALAIAAIVLVGVEFVVLPTYAMHLATLGGAAATSAEAIVAGGGIAFVVRLVLVFLGAGLLGILLFKVSGEGRQRQMFVMATSAFVLVLASEGIGRVLFFDSMIRIGI